MWRYACAFLTVSKEFCITVNADKDGGSMAFKEIEIISILGFSNQRSMLLLRLLKELFKWKPLK
jgi:hypothetical protein